MKKVIKAIFIFVLIELFLISVYPVSTYALTEELSYVDIEQLQDIEIGDLSFSNISFRDYSTTSTQAFGLIGIVDNCTFENVRYVSRVSYYDENYHLIVEDIHYGDASPGVSSFKEMSSLRTLNGYDASEIRYYSVSIEIVYEEFKPSFNLTPSQIDRYSHYDYVIDEYDIHIIVNENNTMDITETITAYFNEPKHGIIRSIPLSNTITRLDGTTSTNRTQVMNVSVDHEYTTKKADGDYKIQIGSKGRTLTGEETYILKYTYNLGKDPIEDYDELYFNIIGTEWDTVIGNVTFTITMPKDFDASKLGFSSGRTGSTDNSNVNYTVNGNTITGSYQNVLLPSEALTVRCELPEGYFVGAGLIFEFLDYAIYLLPVLFLGISIYLCYKFGRDDQVIETVEFYPPAGLNSLEVGFLYKGSADKKDVISLLIYLANKGYIKISEIDSPVLSFRSNDFKITKLKEYDGDNVLEKLFLNGLFEKRAFAPTSFFKHKELQEEITVNSTNEVTSTDLYNRFYITINKILVNMNSDENKDKIFEKANFVKAIYINLMILATYCIISFPFIPNYVNLSIFIYSAIFPIGGFTMAFMTIIGKSQNKSSRHSSIANKILGLMLLFLCGSMFWPLSLEILYENDLFYYVGYIIGLICVFGMLVCLKYLPKRTPYGNEMLGKLRGFKRFLETAEKEKLEALVMQDPTYFYNILPYTYVLDVSDAWIKKFETIALQAPSWYEGTRAFNVVSFSRSINSTMASAQRAMSSSPSGSSGGRSSGGGSSGGGSGGGGGSSW